ncbi:MAG: hypothetical protein COA43_05160 [Robiginitomaculum sp.]|nr:MAG: hypothetical protein COA43_05160 [Robiginitomaculum sp.]
MLYKNRDNKAGDVLRIRIYGFVLHEGILTAEGTVISSSRRNGAVVEESVASFANGHKITNIGPLSDVPPHTAIAYARTRLGQKYKIFSDNCQHFVRKCYKLKSTSPQRDTMLAIGLAALAFIAVF